MAEPLFTEAQWRAIANIEALTDHLDWQIQRGHPSKAVIAPHLAMAEFRVCWFPDRFGEEIFGPPEYTFLVYERVSGLVIADAAELAFALEKARDVVDLIGREYLLVMLARETEAALKAAAEREARAAIAKAKQKPRKITKRARAVFEASEGKCHYCETVLTLDGKWHIEHKVPRALFGGSEQSNLVASCTPCNHAKRDKTDLEFIALRNAAKAG